MEYTNSRLVNPSATWSDIEFLRAHWPGPLVIKGVLSPADARAAVDAGADAIVVSNHGGRQLDGTPATIDILPSVVAAVGDRTEVLMDGGIRRGVDVIRALALGARAVMIGRPYWWGLAAGGQAGVTAVLEALRGELDNAMALLGTPTIASIGPEVLSPRERDV